MRKITLLFILMWIGPNSAYCQTETTVIAPPSNNTNTPSRAPNGKTDHTSLRSIIIITAAELATIPNGKTLSKLGFILESSASASGNIKMYLENTSDNSLNKSITWNDAIATMTNVYDGLYTLPSTAANVDFTLTSPFVYTGGSLYVAWEYSGATFSATSATYTANSTFFNGWMGQASPTTTQPTTLGGLNSFRPCIRFSFAGSGLSTENFITDESFFISPNPTSNFLNIEYNGLKDLDLNISINNILGAKIFEKKYNNVQSNITLDLKSFANDVYFLNISDSHTGATLIKKVLKN